MADRHDPKYPRASLVDRGWASEPPPDVSEQPRAPQSPAAKSSPRPASLPPPPPARPSSLPPLPPPANPVGARPSAPPPKPRPSAPPPKPRQSAPPPKPRQSAPPPPSLGAPAAVAPIPQAPAPVVSPAFVHPASAQIATPALGHPAPPIAAQLASPFVARQPATAAATPVTTALPPVSPGPFPAAAPVTLPSNAPPSPQRMPVSPVFPEPQVMIASPATSSVNPARELSRYVAESKPHIESTHVDRGVEARARAMLSRDEEAALAGAAAAFSATDHHDEDVDQSGRPVLPGFGAAMAVRVRFMGGEVPLWSLLAPVVIVASLSAALAAAAASHAPAQSDDVAAARASASAVSPSELASARAPSALGSTAPAAAAGAADTAGGPAEGFDLPPGSYVAKDVLAIAAKRSARELAGARTLAASLERDPGAAQEPRTLGELRRYSENPDTAKIALESMAKLPAPLAADLLYEVWTGTVERNDITELSRALLFSKDVRPKASKALAVALDLRLADTCEKTAPILPRAIKDADRRSLHLLIRLQRKYGCGPNKRLDCYPCLRTGDDVDSAIKTAREHPEPHTFGKR